MAAESPAANRDPAGEVYGHLPSRRLLLTLLEWTRVQIALNWTRVGTLGCSWLGRLFGYIDALTRHTLRQHPEDEPAARFRSSWALLDRKWSSPADRGWELPSREAGERLDAIEAYLIEAGPTSLVESEPDAPKSYWPEEELKDL